MTKEDRLETIELITEALDVVLEKRDDRMIKIMQRIAHDQDKKFQQAIEKAINEQDKKFQLGLQKQTDQFLEALKPYEKKTEEYEEKLKKIRDILND